MKQITFIGAGSLGFTRGLVRDILTYPALSDTHFSLMDIDPERLEAIEHDVRRIIAESGSKATVSATTDRTQAIIGADAVVCTVLVGGTQTFRHDLEIPKKYGVDLNSGDTRGPGGIMRALRTMPVLLDICRDMEQYCPNAILLNYTNPMNILCKILGMSTSIRYVGLCHSVQNAVEKVAEWTGLPQEELDCFSAGLNHQAWLLKITHQGKDISPLIRQAIERPEVYNEDPVKCDTFRYLGYYSTEEGGQNSEYNQWFRKRPDLVARYDHATGVNPGRWGFEIEAYEEKDRTWKHSLEEWNSQPLDLKRGKEYASGILNAILGDHTMITFNGNLLNKGYITNLPYDSCVEVPILASRRGLEPLHVGDLPQHLAIINNTNARCETLAAEGALEGDIRKIFYAIANDPLTSAVCSLDEIKAMTEELMWQNRAYLPQFKTLKLDL